MLPTGQFEFTTPDVVIVAGTPTSGDPRDMYEDNSRYLIITEVAATPGLDVRFTFEGVRAFHFAKRMLINFKGFNDGASNGDNTKFALWNYDTETWDDVTSDPTDLDDSQTSDEDLQFSVEAEHYCSGDRRAGLSDFHSQIQMRIQHVDLGVITHTLEINRVNITFDNP